MPSRIRALDQAVLRRLGYTNDKMTAVIRGTNTAEKGARATASGSSNERGSGRSGGKKTKPAEPAGNVGVPEGVRKQAIGEVRNMLRRHVEMFNCSFKDLATRYAAKNGVSLNRRAAFVCFDPPYGTRSRRKKRNSKHDVLTTEDMHNTVEAIDDLLMDLSLIHI